MASVPEAVLFGTSRPVVATVKASPSAVWAAVIDYITSSNLDNCTQYPATRELSCGPKDKPTFLVGVFAAEDGHTTLCWKCNATPTSLLDQAANVIQNALIEHVSKKYPLNRSASGCLGIVVAFALSVASVASLLALTLGVGR